jgi:uncharacterized protein
VSIPSTDLIVEKPDDENRRRGAETGGQTLFTVIHTAAGQYPVLTPYVLAIVKLEEGPQITTQIVMDPAKAKIGMKVKSVFRKIATDGESGIIHYGTKFVPVE